MTDKKPNPNQGELAALAAYEQRKAALVKLFTEGPSQPGLPPIEPKQLDPRRYGDSHD